MQQRTLRGSMGTLEAQGEPQGHEEFRPSKRFYDPSIYNAKGTSGSTGPRFGKRRVKAFKNQLDYFLPIGTLQRAPPTKRVTLAQGPKLCAWKRKREVALPKANRPTFEPVTTSRKSSRPVRTDSKVVSFPLSCPTLPPLPNHLLRSLSKHTCQQFLTTLETGDNVRGGVDFVLQNWPVLTQSHNGRGVISKCP